MEIVLVTVVGSLWILLSLRSKVEIYLNSYYWLYILFRGREDIMSNSDGTISLGTIVIMATDPLKISVDNRWFEYSCPNWLERRWAEKIEARYKELGIAQQIMEGLDEYETDKF